MTSENSSGANPGACVKQNALWPPVGRELELKTDHLLRYILNILNCRSKAWIISMTRFGIFSLKNCVYFHKVFVTLQMLSSLQHLPTKQPAQVAGTVGRGKGLLQNKGPCALSPLLHAPSRAAWACPQHSSPFNSCTKCTWTKQQALNFVKAFQSIQVTEFYMLVLVKCGNWKYMHLDVSDEDFRSLTPSMRTELLS